MVGWWQECFSRRGDAFHNHGGYQIECDGRTPEDSKRSLPPVLPTMAGSMEQACARARVLLWRWLGKRCHMSYHYSAIPQFLEHFDCPSYNNCPGGKSAASVGCARSWVMTAKYPGLTQSHCWYVAGRWLTHWSLQQHLYIPLFFRLFLF